MRKLLKMKLCYRNVKILCNLILILVYLKLYYPINEADKNCHIVSIFNQKRLQFTIKLHYRINNSSTIIIFFVSLHHNLINTAIWKFVTM